MTILNRIKEKIINSDYYYIIKIDTKTYERMLYEQSFEEYFKFINMKNIEIRITKLEIIEFLVQTVLISEYNAWRI